MTFFALCVVRQREGETNICLPYADWLPKCLHGWRWTRPELGPQYSIWSFYVGGRDPTTRAIICHPSGCALAGSWIKSSIARTWKSSNLSCVPFHTHLSWTPPTQGFQLPTLQVRFWYTICLLRWMLDWLSCQESAHKARKCILMFTWIMVRISHEWLMS